MAGSLAGIRVLELSEGVSGPYCGKLLAGLGAEVIKVEPPGGDRTRFAGPFPGDRPDPERSGLFLHLNLGKKSIVADVTTVEGKATVEGLLGDADAVLISMRPAQLRAAGIDFGEWRRRFPRLVIGSVTTFGLTGPYADYLGGELIAYAVGGYATLTGDPDREPLKAYGNLVEYQAGAQLALGVVAAVTAREATGEGQLVDCAAMQAATFLLGGVDQGAYFYGRVAKRNGTRLLGFPPEHSYPSTIRPCADGFVHCHSNNRYLDLLGALIPHPRLTDPELLGLMTGYADEIDAIMDEWLADKTRDEIVERAQELRLPFTEVREPGEVMAEPHHKERGSFVTIDHPGAGPIFQPGAPFRMSATPWVNQPAPMLGKGRGATWTKPVELQARTPNRLNDGAGTPLPKAKPLAGVRVIDFTNAVAGPIASFILADLGAEVIKIEAPTSRPKVAAGTAPLLEGAEAPSYNRIMLFNELNHGKRSFSVDVAKPAGRELFLKLAEKSDVVVQNFAPRVMGNLGIDFGALQAVNPRIVLASMPAFGLSGPLRDRISYGPGIDAMSGLSHLTGYPDGPPIKPGNFFCDQQAGVLTAFAVTSALRHARLTGEGQHVELAMIEGEFQVLGDAYIDFAMNGRERRRTGNDHPAMEPHGMFRCLGEDAWVAIAVEDESQWNTLCNVIGQPELAARYPDVAGRKAARPEIAGAITAWTSTRTHYGAQDALQAAGVAAGAVPNPVELLKDPQVLAYDGFEYVETPGVGPTPYPRVAFRLSETPVPVSGPAPGFGEANDYILRDILGVGADDIASLRSAGIVADEPTGEGH
ncbi:MAG: CaiB/BaiF CoA transferase family protein [Dehalococcoidia bacterium]